MDLDHSPSCCPIPKHHWYPLVVLVDHCSADWTWLNDSCSHWISLVDLPIFPADCWRSLKISMVFCLDTPTLPQDSKMSWNTSSSPAVRLYTGYNWRTSMERPTNWRPSGRAGSAHVPKIWSRSFSMNFVAGNDSQPTLKYLRFWHRSPAGRIVTSRKIEEKGKRVIEVIYIIIKWPRTWSWMQWSTR